MANYYAVFASGLKSCDLRWVEYADIVTGTDLLAGCLPIFEITSSDTTCGAGAGGDEGEDSAHLLGVTCMDINMIADLPTLRQHAEYPAFEQQMQASAKKCAVTSLSPAALEALRARLPTSQVQPWVTGQLFRQAATLFLCAYRKSPVMENWK